MSRLIRWDEPPPMDVGAPMPVVCEREQRLLVAYVCSNPGFPGWDSGASPDHPGFDVYSAVLGFEGVERFSLGPPSDESLHKHPLYSFGLQAYGFYEVSGDDESTVAWRRWIITFHDETLDVSAKDARVLHHRVEGEDTEAIVNVV